ncbi:hypothetical protein EWM64_g4867 [Hericium alpestre]|uniref:Helicase C-terminal domain-containing protein n=1 Tax=Hericium alpestre TaxID=135208 RepID=A0A4Y9ZY70_9AGAM|nr:hypothetical protein EWM64_g4867 [Hericium alpestre]
MGCDIPDIKIAVIYGIQDMCSMMQKGGRAGRRPDTSAVMIWLVEDWIFRYLQSERDSAGSTRAAEDDTDTPAAPSQKLLKERADKIDPAALQYIERSVSGECLRDFTRKYFRPTLSMPRLKVIVEEDPEEDLLWQSIGGMALDSDSEDGGEENDSHTVTWEVMQLPPKPPRGSASERADLRNQLEYWRNRRWDVVRGRNPGLSRSWVLSAHALDRLVEKANWIAGARDGVTATLVRRITDLLVDSEMTMELLVNALNRFRLDIQTKRAQAHAEKRAERSDRRARKARVNNCNTSALSFPPSPTAAAQTAATGRITPLEEDDLYTETSLAPLAIPAEVSPPHPRPRPRPIFANHQRDTSLTEEINFFLDPLPLPPVPEPLILHGQLRPWSQSAWAVGAMDSAVLAPELTTTTSHGGPAYNGPTQAGAVRFPFSNAEENAAQLHDAFGSFLSE